MLPSLDAADDGGSEAHIAPRREPNAFAPARPDTLHCYGVDFLSTREVLDLLRDYGPQQVEWLDDSSCNVVFESAEAAETCLTGLPEVAEVVDSALASGLPVLDGEGWIRTRPLRLRQEEQKPRRGGQGRQRAQREYRLQLRVASEADRKDPGHSGHTDSVFYALVKEQQAQQKQAQEARMEKKKRRRSLLPGATSQPKEADPVGPELEDDSWADGAPAPAPAPWSGAPSPFAAATGTAAGAPEEPRGPFGAPAAAAAASPFAGAGAGSAPDAAASAPPARLGLRGALDPLAFLRAPGQGAASAGASAAGAAAAAEAELRRKDADLRSALRRAEEEFTSLLVPGPAQATPAPAVAGCRAGAAGSAARARRRAPGRGAAAPEGGGARAGRAGTPPPAPREGQQRGRKRRPVEQEPRPVSGAEPPRRRVEALPEVENFLAKHRVRCQRYAIHRTFRSITFAYEQQRKRAQLAARGTEAGAAQAPAGSVKGAGGGEASSAGSVVERPWEQYLKANTGFTKNGQFMHTVAFQASGRHILVTIPHPTHTDMDKLARAVQRPKESIKQRKLSEISKCSGFPIFAIPPFGHPKDETGMEPILLVDSTVTELKKPLLFDCGSVGLSIPVSEFFRCTGAACIEGLGFIPEPKKDTAQDVRALPLSGKPAPEKEAAPQEQSPRSVLEPAPEPAPLAPPPGTWVPGGDAAGGGAPAGEAAPRPGPHSRAAGAHGAAAEDEEMGVERTGH